MIEVRAIGEVESVVVKGREPAVTGVGVFGVTRVSMTPVVAGVPAIMMGPLVTIVVTLPNGPLATVMLLPFAARLVTQLGICDVRIVAV